MKDMKGSTVRPSDGAAERQWRVIEKAPWIGECSADLEREPLHRLRAEVAVRHFLHSFMPFLFQLLPFPYDAMMPASGEGSPNAASGRFAFVRYRRSKQWMNSGSPM